jgi:hypothetical protein
LTPNPLTEVVTRNFFDGKGPATLPLDPYSLPTDDVSNSCTYNLQNGLSIILNVYQQTYAPPSAVQDEISRLYQAQPDISGSQVYFYQADKTLEYYIVKTGSIYSQLAIVSGNGATGNPATVAQTLINTITQNVSKEAAHPGGPATMTYDSPVFKKSYANACSLTDNSDFRSLYGVDAGPIAQERLGSSVGVINFHSNGAADINYNYIDNDCERESIVNGVTAGAGGISVSQTYLLIQTESYLDSAPAMLKFAANKQSASNVTPVNAKIGDQVIFSNQAGLASALSFRQGRFLVNLSLAQPGTSPAFSTASMIKYLTPVAQRIAGELQKQQNS